MAEEIITYFKADLSELEAAVSKGEKLIDGYTDATLQATGAENQLGAASGNAAAKVTMLGAATSKTATSEQQLATAGNKAAVSQTNLANATDKSSTKLGFFQRITAGIKNSFNGLVSGIKNFGNTAKESFDKATTGGGAASSVVGQLTQKTGALGGAFTGLGGPIGIAIGLIVGGLGKIIANTDAGAVAIDGLGRTGSIAFDKLTGAVTGFFSKLAEGDSLFAKLASGIGSTAEFIVTKLTPIGLALEATGAADGLRQAAKDGLELATVYDKLDEKQTALIESNAKNDREIGKLNIQLRDRTATDEERLAIADKIAVLETARAQNEIDFLKQSTAAVQKKADQELRDKREVSDETKRLLAQAIAAEEAAASKSEELLERTGNRRNLIVEQSERERAAIVEKAAAEAAKKEQERIAKLNQEKALEGQIREIELQLDDTQLQEGLSEVDKKVLASEDRFRKLAESINKSFNGLKQLAGLQNAAGEPTPKASTPEGKAQLAEITGRQGTALKAVTAGSDEASNEIRAIEAAKQLQLAQDTADKLLEITNTSSQNEVQAIRDKYEELNALVDKNTTDEVDRARQKAQLIVALERDLINQREKSQPDPEKLLETQAEADARELQAIRDKYNEIRGLNEDKADSEAELRQLNAEATLLEDQELFEAMQEQKLEQDEKEAERLAQTVEIATEASNKMSDLIAKAVEDGKVSAEEFGKTLVLILLDTLEKILLIKALEITAFLIEKGAEQAGLPGAIIGAVAGAVIVGLLQGAFAAVKSQVAGNYLGDPYVEGRPQWSGRDGYLRRLDKGERVVTAKANQEHWEPLQAIHEGRFDNWLEGEFDKRADLSPFALNLPDMELMHSVNKYMDGDTGQRLAQSIMFPKYFDRNMVKATERTNQELQTNNTLLAVIVEQNKKSNKGHKRSW